MATSRPPPRALLAWSAVIDDDTCVSVSVRDTRTEIAQWCWWGSHLLEQAWVVVVVVVVQGWPALRWTHKNHTPLHTPLAVVITHTTNPKCQSNVTMVKLKMVSPRFIRDAIIMGCTIQITSNSPTPHTIAAGDLVQISF